MKLDRRTGKELMMGRRKVATGIFVSLLTGLVALQMPQSPAGAADMAGSWTAVGEGMPDGTVFQIATDATGNVYAGGTFTSASGVAGTHGVAKWDGTDWTTVGGGIGGGVYALAIEETSNPDKIYVGGGFTNGASVAEADLAAVYDGTNWQGMGQGATKRSGDGVEEIVVQGQDAIFVGGSQDVLKQANGASLSTDGIAKYTPSAVASSRWSALGSALGGVDYKVNGMTKTASGDIIATGQFTEAGGSPALRVARWDGTTWSPFGSGTSGPNGLTAAVAVDGDDVFVGGTFTSVANTGTSVANTNFIAMWDDSANAGNGEWISIGSVVGTVVEELRVIGDYLYAGGVFTRIGGVTASNIARMDLTAQPPVWEPLVSGCFNGVTGVVRSIIDAGQGSIYVAGGFTNAGGIAEADRIAKFTPTASTSCRRNRPAGSQPDDVLAPTNFRLNPTVRSGTVDGKNGLWEKLLWDAPTGPKAPTIYNVTVEEFELNKAERSLTFVGPRPDMTCWTAENSCEIFMPYSSFGGFGRTEARFKLIGYTSDGESAPLTIEPYDPYAPVFPPGAPTDVVAVSDWNKVHVSWKTPSNIGSYPITNYLVVSSPGNRTCITSLRDADLNKCTYSSLTPGTKYTFKVQALTGAGWGANSEASTTPVSPQNVTITKFTRNRARFLFINRGSDVTVEGLAPGYPAGTPVTIWVKYANSGEWAPLGDVRISNFGTFSWKNRFPTSQDRNTISITVTQSNNRGNDVSMGPVR